MMMAFDLPSQFWIAEAWCVYNSPIFTAILGVGSLIVIAKIGPQFFHLRPPPAVPMGDSNIPYLDYGRSRRWALTFGALSIAAGVAATSVRIPVYLGYGAKTCDLTSKAVIPFWWIAWLYGLTIVTAVLFLCHWREANVAKARWEALGGGARR